MIHIQYATAEIRRGKKKKEEGFRPSTPLGLGPGPEPLIHPPLQNPESATRVMMRAKVEGFCGLM